MMNFVITIRATTDNEEITIQHRVKADMRHEARIAALEDTRYLVDTGWLVERVEIKEVGENE